MVLYILIPFISAAIGWVTNYIAIKMLFHPRRPLNLRLFELQGIFPKRKRTLADRLGRVVSRDLLSKDVINKRIDTEQNREKLKASILNELSGYIETRFKGGGGLFALLATDSVINQIKEKMDEMLDELIPRLMGQITGKVEEVDIEGLVSERVMQFSDDKFEDMLMSVIQKELKFIEIAGAVLGFIIGVIQVALVYGTAQLEVG